VVPLTLIYLDHNSSTPLAPEAFEEMRPFLTEHHGNAASAHSAGRYLAEAVEVSRKRVADLVGAPAGDIVFTSGGTESNNWVLNGVARAGSASRRHVVISGVEHFSVAQSSGLLENEGYAVTVVPPDGDGRIDPARLLAAFRSDTLLVSLMLAQNEVGALEPVAEVTRAAREMGILSHSDAAQAVGKIPVDVERLGVDFLTIAGHKLYGPKGIGALFLRPGSPVASWMLGAPHERGLRAGTLNVPGIVGLGSAAKLAKEKLGIEVPRLRRLSSRLWRGLLSRIEGVLLNGPPLESEDRLPNTVNVSFPGIRSYELLPLVPEVATTAGAACHSGDPRPSATLMAMGLSFERAIGAVRFSLGSGTTEEEIDRTVELFAEGMEKCRGAER